MDIMLERILSLIPKKEDGKYVHGAKKEFAEKLNMSHNLVTMWEKGQSSSYTSKLHEIAHVYGVSVEWLKGETNEKMQKEKHSAENSRVLTPENYKKAYKSMTTKDLYAMMADIAAELQERGDSDGN